MCDCQTSISFCICFLYFYAEQQKNNRKVTKLKKNEINKYIWHFLNRILGWFWVQSLAPHRMFLTALCCPCSSAEPRLLWERVEKLVPRTTGNSGSGGSSSSSSSSNSSSKPGSHCGSGERFRARCESTHPFANHLWKHTQAVENANEEFFRKTFGWNVRVCTFSLVAWVLNKLTLPPPPLLQPLQNLKVHPFRDLRMLGKNQRREEIWSSRTNQRWELTCSWIASTVMCSWHRSRSRR